MLSTDSTVGEYNMIHFRIHCTYFIKYSDAFNYLHEQNELPL